MSVFELDLAGVSVTTASVRVRSASRGEVLLGLLPT